MINVQVNPGYFCSLWLVCCFVSLNDGSSKEKGMNGWPGMRCVVEGLRQEEYYMHIVNATFATNVKPSHCQFF